MRISDWSSDVCSSDLHFVLELLDDLRRNDPQAPVKVELFGLGQPQFARAYPGQEQQPDAKMGLPAARVVEPELLKRSEERRVGKECVSTGRSRWSRVN